MSNKIDLERLWANYVPRGEWGFVPATTARRSRSYTALLVNVQEAEMRFLHNAEPQNVLVCCIGIRGAFNMQRLLFKVCEDYELTKLRDYATGETHNEVRVYNTFFKFIVADRPGKLHGREIDDYIIDDPVAMEWPEIEDEVFQRLRDD